MNNRKVVTLLVAGVLVIGIAALAKLRHDSLSRYPRIEFGETTVSYGELTLDQQVIPRKLPSEIMVYKVQPLESKKDVLLKIFKALPLAPGKKTEADLRQLERMPESYGLKEKETGASIGGWTVQVWDGGQFYITNDDYSNRPYDYKNPPPTPTPKEAQKAADAFLEKIGPLLMNVRFANVVPGDCTTGDKPGDIIIERQLVCYASALGGMPYSSVGVYVGTGSTVDIVSSHIRRTVPDKKVPILSPQEALERLKAREGVNMDGDLISGKVTSIKLKYYNAALVKDVSYIMLVYVFEGEVTGGGKRAEHWNHWKAEVEAIRPEYLKPKPANK